MLSTTCIPGRSVSVTGSAELAGQQKGDGAEVRLPPSCLSLCTHISMLGEQHCCHFCISVLHRKIVHGVLLLEETKLIVGVGDDVGLVGST